MTATERNVPPSGRAINIKAASVSPTSAPFPSPQSIPLDGYTRWRDLRRFIPLSHESVRQRELAGRFPKRVQLGSARSVGWKNNELHLWFADPAGYRAEG